LTDYAAAFSNTTVLVCSRSEEERNSAFSDVNASKYDFTSFYHCALFNPLHPNHLSAFFAISHHCLPTNISYLLTTDHMDDIDNRNIRVSMLTPAA
jgi:hypothetical protein